MYHFNYFIFYMRSFFCSIVVCNKCCCSNKYISNSYFTSTITLSVESCKSFYKHSREIIFFTHKYTFSWYKYIIKYNQSFMSSKFRISSIQSSFFKFSSVARLSSINNFYSFCISRYRKSYCIFFILFCHRYSRHYKYFMRIYYSCLMYFCSSYYYSIFSFFNYMKK